MDVTPANSCKNCSAALTGPYCSHCGQKVPHTDLTVGEFVHGATHELFHWDGKIPSSLKALLLKPGALTEDFLAGRRARWLLPLRLYLICSVSFFVAKPLAEAITHRTARELAKVTVTNPDGSTAMTPEERTALEQSAMGQMLGPERIERVVANNAEFTHAVDAAKPKAMFVLLPLFALLTSIAWRRVLPRYPAHLYFALHIHAAWFAALAIATIVSMPFPTSIVIAIQGLALAYLLWYALVAAHRVFGDSWLRTLLKSFGVAVVYMVCYSAVTAALLVYALYKI